MQPQDIRQRLDEIVLHAAALATSERPAYFAELADTEPDLLAEAQRLLAEAAALPTSFLAVPAGDLLAKLSDVTEEAVAATAAAESPPLTPEERYEIEEMLGQGGMARVYKAWDRQLERWVALKFLDHPSPAMRRRLVREARAQARVQHRHVLEVYETGEREGTPYIAMRYVDGGTLADLGDEVSLEQKVRLSAQVADALHTAHRQGLLHRDVKPSNVLVEETADQELKAWVTDFGIAVRAEGESSAGSEFAGTPHFLPPERLTAGADVDRRADVYSLGVTMYQLFTGESPYAATELIDVLQQIRTAAPRPPREVMPALPPELEAIVLACLARDPSARYPSARAVAEDLQRYLDGEVVEAFTASLVHRLTKFAVRHRWRLTVAGAAAVVLLIMLVAFAVTTSIQSQRIAREAKTAQRVADFVIGMFEDADPFVTAEPHRKRGESVTVREALDRAREKLEADQELAAEPEIRARLLTSLGMVYKNLSLYESAEPLLREALDSRREALGPEHPDVAESLANLGSTLYRTGDWEEAESLLRSSLAMRQRFSGTENLEVAESLRGLANLAYDRGDTAEAETLYKQSLDLYRRLLGTRSPEVADVLNDLALLYSVTGRYADAERLYRESLAIRRQCLGDDHPAIASSLNNLGTLLMRQGDHHRAVPLLRESLALRRRLLGDRHLDVVQGLSNLALALRGQGDPAAAEQLFEEALATARDLLGEEHHIVAIVLRGLASVLVTQDRAVEAEELIGRAIDILRQTYATDHGWVVSAQAVLGTILVAQGRYDQAERLLLKIYPLVRDQAGARSIVLEHLIELYDAWDKPEQAAEYRQLLAAV